MPLVPQLEKQDWVSPPPAAMLSAIPLERMHTHQADGVFINSHAGRTSFSPNTAYELCVRFRDDAGSVSGYAVRTFHTGGAPATFPMEVRDVALSPAPSWVDSDSPLSIVLPTASPIQSSFA